MQPAVLGWAAVVVCLDSQVRWLLADPAGLASSCPLLCTLWALICVHAHSQTLLLSALCFDCKSTPCLGATGRRCQLSAAIWISSDFLLFCGPVVFHCVNVPQLFYPLNQSHQGKKKRKRAHLNKSEIKDKK